MAGKLARRASSCCAEPLVVLTLAVVSDGLCVGLCYHDALQAVQDQHFPVADVLVDAVCADHGRYLHAA